MNLVAPTNQILRQKTTPVSDFNDQVKSLVLEMFDFLSTQEGVGFAAPQVGRSECIAVTGFKPTEKQLKENPDLKEVPRMVLINPRLAYCSKEKNVEKEGCISIPNEIVEVPRFTKIHLEYFDENGKKKKLKARGYLARVFQHEIDHLRGKLITDYKK